MSPADMQRLNEILPDGAQQYFDWVKEQTTHRHDMERKALEAHTATESRGQFFALIIALAFGSAAFILGMFGPPSAANIAIAFISAPLAGIVLAFISGRVIARNENVTKAKILAGQLPNQKGDA